MKTYYFNLLKPVLPAIFLLSLSCNNEEELPVVVTVDSDSWYVTVSTVRCSGKVTDTKGYMLEEWGICWSDEANPTIDDHKIVDTVNSEVFYLDIEGLESVKTYYVRAFATSSAGTGYGNSQSFGTLQKLYTEESPVTDFDGNEYKTVRLGTQTWMAENLKTLHYNNGDPVDTTMNPVLLYNYYPMDFSSRLYRWNVASDSRNVCPSGWHLPSETDWSELLGFLGEFNAGERLKEEGTAHWADDEWGSVTYGTNESGMSVIPVIGDGSYNGIAAFWSSTLDITGRAFYYQMQYERDDLARWDADTTESLSVRCVKD